MLFDENKYRSNIYFSLLPWKKLILIKRFQYRLQNRRIFIKSLITFAGEANLII